jgi:hypothetical protein
MEIFFNKKWLWRAMIVNLIHALHFTNIVYFTSHSVVYSSINFLFFFSATWAGEAPTSQPDRSDGGRVRATDLGSSVGSQHYQATIAGQIGLADFFNFECLSIWLVFCTSLLS